MINYENLAIGTLSNDAFAMVNKKLAREIGFVEAGLLSEIISTYRYVKENYDFYKGGEKWAVVLSFSRNSNRTNRHVEGYTANSRKKFS